MFFQEPGYLKLDDAVVAPPIKSPHTRNNSTLWFVHHHRLSSPANDLVTDLAIPRTLFSSPTIGFQGGSVRHCRYHRIMWQRIWFFVEI
uniref:Uncharacterized protein n=1 Tax=Triticum urartu TaxID=4572 RepID=A0A8R7PTW8_TRIUA